MPANVYAIGVDADQCVSVPDACPVLLTSVQKNMDVAVFDTIKSVMDGTFKGGTNYVGTLANNGVSIAPFHDYGQQDSGCAQDGARPSQGRPDQRRSQDRVRFNSSS